MDRQKDYTVDISYYRSWKEKELALKRYMEVEEACRLLPSYMAQLLRIDSGAQTYLVCKVDGSFFSFLGHLDLVCIV